MRARTAATILLVVGLMAPTGTASQASNQAIPKMTLREKIGQLVMFPIGGKALSETERSMIEDHHLGGVILFAHNYQDRSQLVGLNRQIQRAVRSGNPFSIGALIGVDQEGGIVKRFPDMPPGYSAPRMGEAGRRKLALRQGRATGRALREAGVNLNFAPVADLDIGPQRVMRERSFGSGPDKVARLAGAFAEGLQDRRVGSSPKHFPGLGGASTNSDDGRAFVYRSKRQLHRVDSVPFHKAVAKGTRLMMVGHAMYMNDGGRRPASLNPYILNRRLRGEFGFTGVAISDALEPVSWRFDGDTPKACKATIDAGMDVALLSSNVQVAAACAERIYQAVRRGGISNARIDDAVERVLRLKSWLGLYDPPA